MLIERINSDLANILGNLVNRTISMANKYFDGKVENKNITDIVDEELLSEVKSLDNKITEKMDKLEVGLAIEEIFNVLRRSNKYVDETMPWVLAKEEDKKERLETVIFNLLNSIRECTYYLQAFLPNTSNEICRQLNISLGETNIDIQKYEVNEAKPLFERIDKEKKMSEISK